ncbi:FecR domain-containing protein, partial [Candidatus Omnitrophota bacterium]
LPSEARPYLDAELTNYEKDVEPEVAAKWALKKKTTKMSGRITTVRGSVRILKEGKADWRPANPDERLSQGDKIQTDEDGAVDILLDNGNMLFLQPNTELGFTTLRQDPATGEYENIFESNGGKIKAVIGKLGKKSTFRIKSPTAICGVRGTVVYVNIQPGGGTTAYYEGGYGVVTSTLTGETENVGSGSNSSVDANGVVSAPAHTTTGERMALNQAWGGSLVAGEYSSPSPTGDSGQGPVISVSGTVNASETPEGGVEGTVDLELSGDLISFDDACSFFQNLPLPVKVEHRLISGRFGYIGEVGGRAVMDDLSGYLDGTLNFNFGGSAWSTATGSIGQVSFSQPANRYLLQSSFQGILVYDNEYGKYEGFIRGSTRNGRIRIPIAAIYHDPTGRGGAFTSFFTGTATPTTFSATMADINITNHGILDIDNLFDEAKETSLFSGRGLGSFDAGGGLICGGTGSLTAFGGQMRNLVGRDWGILYLDCKGTFSGLTGDTWKLAIGGEDQLVNSDKAYWCGAIDGTAWNTNSMEGTFEGIWLSKTTDLGDDAVTGGIIQNGYIAGDYDAPNWEGSGTAEWFQVTDLLTEANLGFTIAQLGAFVNVPVTENYSVEIPLQTAVSDAVFASGAIDVDFYSNAVNRLWGGTISGTIDAPSPAVPGNWALVLDTLAGDKITLAGDQWANGVWHATVNTDAPTNNATNVPGGGTIAGGDAGGTYSLTSSTEGTFNGIVAGTWTSP